MRTGGLYEILKTLLNNDKKDISNQELICLLQKIENDATEIGHAKYGLDEKIKFNIDCDDTSNSNLIGRQSAKSLQCIRQSIKKNLDLMGEDILLPSSFSPIIAIKWALCCIKTYSPKGLSLNEQGLFTIQVIILVGGVANCI
jgi:hypothetical protein